MILTLKQARLLKGFTQRDIANKLGVHVQTYSKMEKQPDEVTIGDAKKICEILELSYDFIFFNTNSTLSREFDDGLIPK
ncbi:helix-turn-helix domain-containing protein [Peribacillus loiseleuriae]|uniref:helix-turn-helix domain-containing protein n=1 Tax=Peribacillus loiseleuriae TaxID=1679170 RepID=UPI003CFFB51A